MSTNNDPYSLDFLIPDHILELCQLDKFDLSIHLVATAANNQYPLIRVKINDKIIFDEQCRAVTEIHHLLTSKDPVQVTVEYYGRTDKDTVVDSEGNIVENQHLELTKIVVNDVDIVKNSIILFSLAQFLFFSFYDLLNFARMGLCVAWQNEEYFLIIYVLYLWDFWSHFGSHFLDCWNCWCCWFCLGCCCLSS